MKDNLMIDLETLGTKPNSAILSIGAVFFDKNGLGKEFYVNVDLASSIEAGFEIDPETIYWWLSQDKEAGKVLNINRNNFRVAIYSLCNFIMLNCDTNKVKVWANSPSFDLVMLKNYADKMNTSMPWKFWNERDDRTAIDIYGCEKVKSVVAHNALEDAKAQAQTLINFWNKQSCVK